jgi:hypothetical protein
MSDGIVMQCARVDRMPQSQVSRAPSRACAATAGSASGCARKPPSWPAQRPDSSPLRHLQAGEGRRPSHARLMPAASRGETAAARGYGYDHQQRRKALLPDALGTPCPLRVSSKCTGLMTDPALMDLDHSKALAQGGRVGDRIVCSSCNRSAGARLGNLLRRRRRRPRERRRSREW